MATRFDMRDTEDDGIYISFNSKFEAEQWIERNKDHPLLNRMKMVEKVYESAHEKMCRIENENETLRQQNKKLMDALKYYVEASKFCECKDCRNVRLLIKEVKGE